jgi:hypothetical protein
MLPVKTSQTAHKKKLPLIGFLPLIKVRLRRNCLEVGEGVIAELNVGNDVPLACRVDADKDEVSQIRYDNEGTIKRDETVL